MKLGVRSPDSGPNRKTQGFLGQTYLAMVGDVAMSLLVLKWVESRAHHEFQFYDDLAGFDVLTYLTSLMYLDDVLLGDGVVAVGGHPPPALAIHDHQ